jgi:hypothetical protein
MKSTRGPFFPVLLLLGGLPPVLGWLLTPTDSMTLIEPPVSSQASSLERVEFKHCGRALNECLVIRALEGDISNLQNTMSFSSPQVHGLGFEDKVISSVVIDFNTSSLFLRERQKGVYVGEWKIHLDTLNVAFFPVPK